MYYITRQSMGLCEKVKLIIVETCVLCIRIYFIIGNIIPDIHLDSFCLK